MGKILGWFAQKKEMDTFAEMIEHCRTTKETVKALQRLFAGKEKLSQLRILEHKNDELKRHIIQQLAQSTIDGSDKADLTALARQLDKITNYLLGAGTNLSLIKVEGKMRKKIEGMFVNCEEIVTAVEECLTYLAQHQTEEAMAAADRVEKLETEMDDLYGGAKEQLLKEKMGMAEMLILKEALFMLESSTDSCEHSVDMIRLMLVRVW